MNSARTALALALLWFAPAAAQDFAYDLSYDWKALAGTTAVYKVELDIRSYTEVVGKTKLADEDAEARQADRERGGGEVRTLTTSRQERVFGAPKAGRGRVKVTLKRLLLEAVQPKQNGEGTERVSYDSRQGGPVPPQAKGAAQTLDKPITLEVTKKGDVKWVEGIDRRYRKQYENTFYELPKEPLEIGDGWERLVKQPFGGIATVLFLFQFKLQRVEQGPDGRPRYRIAVKIRTSLSEQSPLASNRVRLLSQGGNGLLVLDERGLMLESLLENRYEIELVSSAGKQITKVHTKTRETLQD